MDYEKIEKKFAEYIINLHGPNLDQDKSREMKYEFIKNLILNYFENFGKDQNAHGAKNSDGSTEIKLKPHIFCFGSYPLKTYLQDSDLDITIIFEDKLKGTYLLNNSFDFLNRMLSSIQNCFETHNSERKQEIFTDINLIFADIKLVKCKYENLSIDISINNLVGLSKLVVFNYLESQMRNHFYRPDFFKRSLVLIKAWCNHEGNILGSNISLMANYALEVLVLYIFNKYHAMFKTEFDFFFTFVNVISQIEWNNEIMHLFGSFSIDDCQALTKTIENVDSPFWYLSQDSSEKFLFSSEEIIKLVNKLERFRDESNWNKKNLNLKYLNIIDPIFSNNNLGKSINMHNYTKIRKVLEFLFTDVQKIIQSRSSDSAIKYLNSLLMLFSKSITQNNPELFLISISQPKILINPYLNINNESISKNGKQNNHNMLMNTSLSFINDESVMNFNKLFSKSDGTKGKIITSNIFENVKYDPNSNINFLTKDILEYFTSQNENNNDYDFPNFYAEFVVEEFLKKIE